MLIGRIRSQEQDQGQGQGQGQGRELSQLLPVARWAC